MKVSVRKHLRKLSHPKKDAYGFVHTKTSVKKHNRNWKHGDKVVLKSGQHGVIEGPAEYADNVYGVKVDGRKKWIWVNDDAMQSLMDVGSDTSKSNLKKRLKVFEVGIAPYAKDDDKQEQNVVDSGMFVTVVATSISSAERLAKAYGKKKLHSKVMVDVNDNYQTVDEYEKFVGESIELKEQVIED